MANILAIDTATEACSVALTFNGKKDSIFEICPQQHSQKVLEFVDTILKRNNVKLNQLDALAYGCGPGSFTGVRIAASTIQGLAFGTGLPVAQISTLAAMAYQNFKQNQISKSLVLIDARMAEVYKGLYSCADGSIRALEDEEVIPPAHLVNKLKELEIENCLGTGFASYKEDLNIEILPKQLKVEYPNALYMLDLAEMCIQSNGLVSAEEIAPTYLRDKVTWKKLPHKA